MLVLAACGRGGFDLLNERDDAPCTLELDCRAALAPALLAAFLMDGNLEALHAGGGPAYVGNGFAVDASTTRVHGSGAYAFRGVAAESRVEVPGLMAVSDELTWMTWVRVAPAAQQVQDIYPRIVDQWAGYFGARRGCALSIGADPQGGGTASPGQPFFECFDEAGTQYSAIASMDIRDDAWHHVAGTWSSSAGRVAFFVDGTELAALTFPPGTRIAPNTDPLMLGGADRGFRGWESFVGYLDEAYFFNAALSPALIQHLETHPLTAADLE